MTNSNKNNVVQMRPANPVVRYEDIAPGVAFKVLKSEVRKKDWYNMKDGGGIRVVENDGTYVKIADSHAHELGTGKDAIFPLKMPCRILTVQPNEQFVKLLPDWAIVNAGAPAAAQVAKRA